MAQTIATAYVDIMPSTRGLKAALDKEVTPVAKQVGTTTGKAMGDAISTETGRSVGPAMKKVLERAATEGKVSFATKIRGIGASLSDEFNQTGKISGTLSTVGASMGLTGEKARGLAERFRSVQGASNGMQAGLSGVSGILMGPWGIALAGAGLALNTFITAQENATKAGEKFLETLDKQTGASTIKTYQTAAQDLLKEFSSEELAKTPFTIEQVTGALVRGGQELEDLKAKIKQLGGGSGFLGSIDGTAERYNRLGNAVENLSSDVARGGLSFKEQQKALIAASLAANGAGDGYDELRAALYGTEIAGGATAASLQAAAAATAAQARAAQDAAAKQTIFDLGMQSIANAADLVKTRIDAIPKDVRITAKAVGLDAITAAADAAAGAYLRMAAAASAANSIVDDGERHGADVGGASPAGQAGNKASKLAAAAAAAKKAARDAMRARNRALASRSSSGSSGSRAASAAASARKAARKALGDSVSGSFAKDLASEDVSGIQRMTTDLIEGAKAALNGAKETALVKLLKRDNGQLKGLANQRAAIQKRLSENESALSDLRSQKASTISSVSQNLTGNLTGARSASGIRRVLTRQLAAVKAFGANMRTLAARGLPKVFLRQLFDAGLDGAATAAALARSNGADFETIKNLTSDLSTEANKLGVDAGSILYDEGIATAQGLIAGLRSQDAALEAQLLKMAKSMKKAIKQALGIKSPSRVFEHYGRMVSRGMANGVEKGSGELNRSIVGMVRIPQQRATRPAAAESAAAGGGNLTIPVYAAANPIETAHAVANEIVWRSKR